jgi:hypothetical protein
MSDPAGWLNGPGRDVHEDPRRKTMSWMSGQGWGITVVVLGLAAAAVGQGIPILYTLRGDSAEDGFGSSVAGIGDVNGDGHADVAISAPGDDTGGSEVGSVIVVSGNDGTTLWRHDGSAGNLVGGQVAVAGDVNGDGIPDLLVSVRPGGRGNGDLRPHA